MQDLLTGPRAALYAEYLEFARAHVEPFSEGWDVAQVVPDEALARLAAAGYLGCCLPTRYGGQGQDAVAFGLLNEALGRYSSSFTGVVTVQAMVAAALLKWGSDAVRQAWLPRLARGETIAAFAMTEPGAGSATHALSTRFSRDGSRDGLVLDGIKRWITFGQRADVFLVFGVLDGRPVACLVPRGSPGLAVEPIRDLMGFRSSGLAQLTFAGVRIPSDAVVGKVGFAQSHVAPVGLQYGRISTACSALGLLRGCFEESVGYAAKRAIGDRKVGDAEMVRSMIARMGADLAAAGRLCLAACESESERGAEAYEHALVAKYFVSRAVVAAASDAVQIHGATGCHAGSPVSRFYRDAKIMEIIEGTTQIHEQLLARAFLGRAAATAA
jgi:alkylation response protein AidB-like acyl-CoA dehydrogenase